MEVIDKDPMLKQVRAKVDDRNHEILYKSPGPHRGSRYKGEVQTYDFVQATTKEDAARLIAEGWSVSEEEAYELAEALKAGKKGKKALAVRAAAEEELEADEDADDLGLDEEPAPAPKKAKKKAKK